MSALLRGEIPRFFICTYPGCFGLEFSGVQKMRNCKLKRRIHHAMLRGLLDTLTEDFLGKDSGYKYTHREYKDMIDETRMLVQSEIILLKEKVYNLRQENIALREENEKLLKNIEYHTILK